MKTYRKGDETKDIWISQAKFVAVDGSKNVYDAAVSRIEFIFDNFETVIVSFSGGKDSTVTMQLALDVARRRNRLPLKVLTCDDEVIDPDTVLYQEWVASQDYIDFTWLCIPIAHTLRSNFRSVWWPWDPDEEHVWAREWPHRGVGLPGFEKGIDDGKHGRDTNLITYAGATNIYVRHHLSEFGKTAILSGVRTQEAMNRRRAIMGSGSWYTDRGYCYTYAKPIYDWGYADVWKAMLDNNWRISAFYKKATMAGVRLSKQRVAVWGNAASEEVRLYQQFYPEFWGRAIRRLPELKAMGRYRDSKLYKVVLAKPTYLTWQQYTWHCIEQLDKPSQKQWIHYIKLTLARWKKKNTTPYPDVGVLIDGEFESERCWKKLATIVTKNDFSRRDQS